MDAKKFLIVVLVVGLIKVCHATPMPLFMSNNIQIPQSNAGSVSIYPCLACAIAMSANTNCLSQNLQGGVKVKVMF
ncbi:MAG: hypothetical protein Q7V63_01585 [Gammaproteobacteria bacterium]|nr:hypothetical protein [Gammaproteobacteria bacterium]